MKPKGIIIGAGIAGIAAAIRLSKKGYNVEVFEANSYPGGKLSDFSLGAYRFDAGPSLFTMPHFVDELFELCDENPRDYFNYKKKSIACQYFWEDKTTLIAYSDPKKFAQEVEDKLQVSPRVLQAYLDKAKTKYDLTANLFLNQSLHRLKTYWSKDTIKAIGNLSKMEIEKSLDEVNTHQLKEPHLVQFFNRFATYNGSSPYKTPGIMSLVQHLESHYGTYFPEGGMVEISQSLFALAKRQGVVFHMEKKVEQILIKNKKAIGVLCDGIEFLSDVVVSNMDIYPTYKKLLPSLKMPRNVRREERSSSAIIFYWGINKKFDEMDLHNIFFSNNYPAEFKAIFEDKAIYEDPTIYVNITAKETSNDAPKGAENWFVMINTAADYGQDWASEIDKLRKLVLAKLSRMLGCDMATFIKEEVVLSPPEIQAKTESHMGALYGSSSNNKMAAFLRHPNFKFSIKQLFFCGGSVHPGGGIPLCLLSAKIVSEQLPPS